MFSEISAFRRILAVAAFAVVAAGAYARFAVAETVAPQAVVRFSESFDGVVVPALPSGWTTTATGSGVPFQTVAANVESLPNAAFSPGRPTTGSAEIVSPPIQITSATAVLNFRHRYSLETTWDGGVLEIKIGNGPFQDIISAGGVFLAGPYSRTLNPSTNPLAGRDAWTGSNSGNFILTSVRLPASTFGQTVSFRWIHGSNDSFTSEGWYIDSVTVEGNPVGVNAASIDIPTAGTASVYPSTIAISGQPGPVTGVSVSLENFSHAFPDDVDVMLVAPDGRRVELMSDAGGATPVVNQNLVFNDSAASAIPDAAPIAGGVYRVANYEGDDSFPAPAPQGSVTATTLGAFYGTNPNGTWSLYVVDDNVGNGGAIGGGWTLDLKTSASACTFSLNPTVLAFPAAGGGGSFQLSIPDGCAWTVSTTSSFINLGPQVSGVGAAPIGFTVGANGGPARTGLISVSDGFNVRTFQIQQAGGCPTSVAQTALSFGANGGGGSVGVVADAGCSWIATTDASWISVTSASQSGNGNATFNVAPNASRSSRSATVNVGARSFIVNQAGRGAARFDFDGDGRDDISVYRDGVWYLQRSSAGTAVVSFGLASDKLAPADFDGDGKTDIAVYRGGVWYVLQSSNGAFFAVQFGLANDVPLPSDVNGDGRAELVVYRGGVWYAYDLATGATSVTAFGLAGDRPVPADYDGDGKTDFAVYRNGDWYLQRSTAGFAVIRFGISTDRPLTGDFDGDGRADLAVYRDGEWHVLNNLQTYATFRFGLASDVPTAADYDGDGKSDAAVYRAGVWYVLPSGSGAFYSTPFGLASDRPVPAAFLP